MRRLSYQAVKLSFCGLPDLECRAPSGAAGHRVDADGGTGMGSEVVAR